MSDSKLYSALLKSQEEQRRLAQKEGEAKPEDNFRKERPYAGSDRLKPNQAEVEVDYSGYPPSVYDAATSLNLIGNPNPWSHDQLRERKIIYSGMVDKEVMDAYRELRIQLRAGVDAARLSVLFSSLGRRDNSVLTAFNLAAAFALDAHTSALLVDCDPYNQASLAKLVSCQLTAGVTDFVSDSSLRIRDILYPSGVNRLSVIPAGTQVASAVELFSAVRMRDLVMELENRYPDRCLVINAPPFLESTEARILERFADKIVFGVPFGEVTSGQISDSVEALNSEKFAGLVFQE